MFATVADFYDEIHTLGLLGILNHKWIIKNCDVHNIEDSKEYIVYRPGNRSYFILRQSAQPNPAGAIRYNGLSRLVDGTLGGNVSNNVMTTYDERQARQAVKDYANQAINTTKDQLMSTMAEHMRALDTALPLLLRLLRSDERVYVPRHSVIGDSALNYCSLREPSLRTIPGELLGEEPATREHRAMCYSALQVIKPTPYQIEHTHLMPAHRRPELIHNTITAALDKTGAAELLRVVRDYHAKETAQLKTLWVTPRTQLQPTVDLPDACTVDQLDLI